MRRKQNLVSAFGIKKKLGGTMHCSEIHVIKLQFGKKKKRHTLLCILLLFRIIVA